MKMRKFEVDVYGHWHRLAKSHDSSRRCYSVPYGKEMETGAKALTSAMSR